MYKQFFGFKERPFNLVPDPTYLFLSRSHEEALAHLSYAIHQGDGFVEITGEVGTGKTTLCRVFLESLGEDTEAAYIFNPKLDAIQLLKTINDEFHIPSDADNTKDLIDALNGFLLEKKAQGKRILLLIDEAQNLTMPVMEQIRLLSNLETTRSKLLQIILVGQPELGQMLDSHELRQLAQRITLSCHLRPLDFRETRNYILHRISVAAKKPSVRFTRGAFRAIYRYSGGIPRLINIVCDRALLTAYSRDQRQINGRIARMAIRELTARHRQGISEKGWLKPVTAGIGVFLCLLAAVFFGARFWRQSGGSPADSVRMALDKGQVAAAARKAEPLQDPAPHPSSEAGSPGARPAPSPEAAGPVPPVASASASSPEAKPVPILEEKKMDFDDLLKELPAAGLRGAMQALLSLWKAPGIIPEAMDAISGAGPFYELAARQNGLMLRWINGTLEDLEITDLPAILELSVPETGEALYLALVGIDSDTVALTTGELPRVTVAREILETYWTGAAFIPWNDFFRLTAGAPSETGGVSVISLKMLLKEMGYDHLDTGPVYDEATEAVIRDIQEKSGLEVDGIVGSATRIALYNAMGRFPIPHIRKGKVSLNQPQEPTPTGEPRREFHTEGTQEN